MEEEGDRFVLWPITYAQEKFEAGAGHDFAVDIALETCAILNKMDQTKKKLGKEYWFPEKRD